MIKIPKDIKQIYSKKLAKALVKLAIPVSALLVIVIFFNVRIVELSNTGSILKIILLVLIAIIISLIPYKLLSKSLKGTIIEITPKNVMINCYRSCTKQLPILTKACSYKIKDINGKIHKVVLSAELNTHDEYANLFKIGDEVIYVRGASYLQIIPKTTDEKINCVVCGGMQEQGNEKCMFCGHTLHINY